MAVESVEQMIPCSHCGQQVREQAVFCPHCGLRLGMESEQLYPGSALSNGRYVVQRLLGQGGGGAVYLAEDRNLARSIVVKELQGYFKSVEERRRAENDFRREALILARLSADHPNLPQTFDHFTEGTRHYLVMQYVSGENLEQRLRRLGGKLVEKEVLQYGLVIADILAFIHAQKPEPVVHRDIKPANIIVDNQGRVKLVDFGLAKAMGREGSGQLNSQHLSGALGSGQLNGDSNAAGTAGYTPVEQWQGRAEPASDVYALGATMHHLFSGRDPRDPFNAYPELNLDIVRRLSFFPPLRQLRPEITPATEGLLLAMLDPAPAKRPTAVQVRSEIQRILTALNQAAPTAADLLNMGQNARQQPAPNLPPQPRHTAGDRLLQRTAPTNQPPPASPQGQSRQNGQAGYAGPRLERLASQRNQAGDNDLLAHASPLNPAAYRLGNNVIASTAPPIAGRAFRFSAVGEVSYALQTWLRGYIQFLPLNEPLDVHVQGLTLMPLYLANYMIDAPLPQINQIIRRQGAIILDVASDQPLPELLADLWLPEWRGLNTAQAQANASSSTPTVPPQLLTLRDLSPAYGAPPRPPLYSRSELQLQERIRTVVAQANGQSIRLESFGNNITYTPNVSDIHLTQAEAVYGALWHASVLLRGKSYTLSAYEGSKAGAKRGLPGFLLRDSSFPSRAFCTVCGGLFFPEQVVQCEQCGKSVCEKDRHNSGFLNKHTYCSNECQARAR